MTTSPDRSPGVPDHVRQALQEGEFLNARMHTFGSNAVFDSLLSGPDGDVRAIYKPQRGEEPLWDFPSGTLYKRERAAYVVAQTLGWDFIPLTVVRDGPYGVGAVQLYVDHDPQVSYFTLADTHTDQLSRMAAFDVLTNNADRKGGHCLLDADGRIWGIDHGLTFNVFYKLRTVIWDFQGEAIAPGLLQDLEALFPALESDGDLSAQLEELLDPQETEALRDRLETILEEGVYPAPGLERNVPWPPV